MVQLARFPRFSLGHFPTPLESMTRLTAQLRESVPSTPNLWIKRDDCTGLAPGGNKNPQAGAPRWRGDPKNADVLIAWLGSDWDFLDT